MQSWLFWLRVQPPGPHHPCSGLLQCNIFFFFLQCNIFPGLMSSTSRWPAPLGAPPPPLLWKLTLMGLTVTKEFHETVMRDAASATPSSSGACLLGVVVLARGSNRSGPSWWMVYCSSWSTFQGILGVAYCHTSLSGRNGWEWLCPHFQCGLWIWSFLPIFKAQAKSRPLLYLAGNPERDWREIGSPTASVSSSWLVLESWLPLLHNGHSEGPCSVCGDPMRRQI